MLGDRARLLGLAARLTLLADLATTRDEQQLVLTPAESDAAIQRLRDTPPLFVRPATIPDIATHNAHVDASRSVKRQRQQDLKHYRKWQKRNGL